MEAVVLEAKNRVFKFSLKSPSGYVVEARQGSKATFGTATPVFGNFCVTVTHNLNDASYGVLAMADWPAELWLSSRSANSFQVCFTTYAPSGGKLLWEVSPLMPTETVTAGSLSHTVNHGKNDSSVPIFALTTWPTQIYDSTSDRAANTAVLRFTSAPASDGQIVWRAAE